MSSLERKQQLQNEINYYTQKLNKYLTKYENLFNQINGGGKSNHPHTPNKPVKKITPKTPTKRTSNSPRSNTHPPHTPNQPIRVNTPKTPTKRTSNSPRSELSPPHTPNQPIRVKTPNAPIKRISELESSNENISGATINNDFKSLLFLI